MDRTRQIGQILNYIFGNGAPAPYMGLGIGDRVKEGWDNFAQRYLPQAPGMQKELFPMFDENDPYAYALMKNAYKIQ